MNSEKVDRIILEMQNKIKKQLPSFNNGEMIIFHYLNGYNKQVRIPRKLWIELFGGAR